MPILTADSTPGLVQRPGWWSTWWSIMTHDMTRMITAHQDYFDVKMMILAIFFKNEGLQVEWHWYRWDAPHANGCFLLKNGPNRIKHTMFWNSSRNIIQVHVYARTPSIKPNPKKVKAIMDLQRPTTTTEVRRVIGLVQYYRDELELQCMRNQRLVSSPSSCLGSQEPTSLLQHLPCAI